MESLTLAQGVIQWTSQHEDCENAFCICNRKADTMDGENEFWVEDRGEVQELMLWLIVIEMELRFFMIFVCLIFLNL